MGSTASDKTISRGYTEEQLSLLTNIFHEFCLFSIKICIFAPIESYRGQLAFLRMFILVAISIDANDNRRHVHVFYKGKRHQRSLAKIWIESNGQQCVEIAESSLSAKDNEMLVAAINRHWEFINEQVTRAFNGEKTISIDIEK